MFEARADIVLDDHRLEVVGKQAPLENSREKQDMKDDRKHSSVDRDE